MNTISDATLDALVAQAMNVDHEPQDRIDALSTISAFFATDATAAERIAAALARVEQPHRDTHWLRTVRPTYSVTWEQIQSLSTKP